MVPGRNDDLRDVTLSPPPAREIYQDISPRPFIMIGSGDGAGRGPIFGRAGEYRHRADYAVARREEYLDWR